MFINARTIEPRCYSLSSSLEFKLFRVLNKFDISHFVEPFTEFRVPHRFEMSHFIVSFSEFRILHQFGISHFVVPFTAFSTLILRRQEFVNVYSLVVIVLGHLHVSVTYSITD